METHMPWFWFCQWGQRLLRLKQMFMSLFQLQYMHGMFSIIFPRSLRLDEESSLMLQQLWVHRGGWGRLDCDVGCSILWLWWVLTWCCCTASLTVNGIDLHLCTLEHVHVRNQLLISLLNPDMKPKYLSFSSFCLAFLKMLFYFSPWVSLLLI